MNYDIVVIGAGTSTGFLLAFLNECEAARKLRVLVLEKTRGPFRKVYCSGNGRCNFSNTVISDSSYYSVSGSAVWKKAALAAALKLDLKQYFHAHGIPSYNDEFGRLMPYTNSAKTIGNYLERHLKSANVQFHAYAEAVDVVENDKGFVVKYVSNN